MSGIVAAVIVVSVLGFLIWYGNRQKKAGADEAANVTNTKVLKDAQAVADARADYANLKRVRDQSFRD